jgi:hypothetical protein
VCRFTLWLCYDAKNREQLRPDVSGKPFSVTEDCDDYQRSNCPNEIHLKNINLRTLKQIAIKHSVVFEEKSTGSAPVAPRRETAKVKIMFVRMQIKMWLARSNNHYIHKMLTVK